LKIIKDSVLAGIPIFILNKKISELKNQYFPQKLEKEEVMSNLNTEKNTQEEKKEIIISENSPISQVKNNNNDNNHNLTFSKINNNFQKSNNKENLDNHLKSIYLKIFDDFSQKHNL